MRNDDALTLKFGCHYDLLILFYFFILFVRIFFCICIFEINACKLKETKIKEKYAINMTGIF